MLRIFLKSFGRRNFSSSSGLKNIVPNSGKQPSKQVEDVNFNKGVSMDFIPTEKDKFILVLSGRYKSKSEIPQRISFCTIDNAKSRLRIRFGTILMVGTLICCGIVVWHAKQRVKAGESIVTVQQARDREILERTKKNY